MKIKNSYVLIVIAIFLLIGIGSVCASENVTDNSDVQLADDGTDVVLSDTDENVPDETTQEPINTTVETDKDKYEFKEDSNKTIPVQIKDNDKSSPINVTKNDLSVSNGNKNISFEYNGTIITITEKLSTGKYNFTISYLGNANYTESYKVVAVKIYGNNTIETETSVVCDGKNIAIPVKVSDQVDYVELIKNNFNLTLVYTNETGNVCNLTIRNFDIENDTIKFQSNVSLIAASLIIDYVNASEPKIVGIKISTEVKAEKDELKFKSEEIKNISIEILDGQGNLINVTKNDLKVFNNGTNITFNYNNSMITVELPEGVHNITIAYQGNETYNASSKDIIVKVSGNTTIITEDVVYSDGVTVEVPVKVFDGADYLPLDGNLTVTLTYTNETGNVTKIENMTFTAGEDKITITPNVKLIAASITLNYTDAEPKTVLVKLITSTSATADKTEFNAKENKTITVTVLDSQNNPLSINANDLKVLENGNEIAFTYNSSVITITSISEGAHNLTIVYKGNDTYSSSNATNVSLNVYGNNQINVPTFVVSEDGKTVEIPVYIFNGLKNITIDGNSFAINLTYTNETGNATTIAVDNFNYNDGKITATFDVPLNKASLTIDYVDSTGAKTVKVNLATEVNATPENFKYRYNETNNITIRVFDYAENKLNITQDSLKVFDNGKEIAFTFNNSNITVSLAEGVHNLTITYKGDDTYNSSSRKLELRVYGDIRFDPTSTVILGDDNAATITVNLNDGVDLVDINKTKLTVTVFYKVNNQTFNKTVEYTLNGQNITFKLDDDFESAYANLKYDNKLTANTTIKVNTVISAEDMIKGDTEVKNLTIEIKGTNGHNITLDSKNIQVLNNGKALNIDVNNTVITIKNAFKNGIYNLTIKYLGEDTYLASLKNITLTVYTINATASTNINSTKKGEIKVEVLGNGTINITKDDLKLNVTYKKGNDTVEIKVTDYSYVNGTLYFTLENGNFTTATLNIKYNNTEKNVTLNRIYNVEIIVLNSVNEYKSGNFSFKLVDIDAPNEIVPEGSKFTLTTEGNIRAGHTGKTDANGIVTYKNVNLYEYNGSTSGGNIDLTPKPFVVGNHTVEVSTSDNVKSKTTKVNLTITPAHVKIDINPYKEYYGSVKNVTVTVTNSLNEPMVGIYVKLTIDGISGTYYLYTNSDGKGQISIYNQQTKAGLVGGNYKFHASNNDTVNIINASDDETVTVLKIPTTINTKDVTVYYNSGTTSKITVKDKNGKAVSGMYLLVRLYSTSKKYNDYLFQTDKKGQVAFSASLDVGKHKIIVSSADNRYSASKVTKTITVKKTSAKITAKKVKVYYKSGGYLTVKLTNSKTKKPIYNGKINIKIFISKNRYYNYNGNTGMNGKLKLLVDTLKPKTYKVEVSGADNKNFNAKMVKTKIVVKKTTAKLTPKKLTAKKGAKKYFKITVKNKKTKKPVTKSKLKVKVYTGKKAKTYKVKTNSKGVAKLSTAKLKVGKHKVVVSSAQKYVKAKKAKSTIKIKK